MTILETLADPRLFGRRFDHESWAWWRSFLAALFGPPIEGDDLKRYQDATGREPALNDHSSEGYAIVGRRGGKSRLAALVGVYLACFGDYSGILSHGERGVVMILAPDRRQARVVMGYVRALLEVPLLASMVLSSRREAIDLRNNISIEVHTASYRTVRGYTIVAAILDVLALLA